MIEVAWNAPETKAVREKNYRTALGPLRAIVLDVALKHKLTVAQVLGRQRSRPFVLARQEAMWRCHRETYASLPQIGEAMDGRDHTTILHGIRQHEKRLGNGA